MAKEIKKNAMVESLDEEGVPAIDEEMVQTLTEEV